MEKMPEEMIYVTVYADSTNQFTEEECNCENMIDIEFPRRIVYGYYKEHEADFVSETMADLGISKEYCTFDKWLKEVYTCDDTADLFMYALLHGYTWTRQDEPTEWCDSEDHMQIEVCAECGAENEIRWDINEYGFEAYCPHCGAHMMLCDACHHKYGECFCDCDWCAGKGCHMDNAHRKPKKNKEETK